MPERGQRFDVDPTVVPVVHTKEGNTAVDREHDVIGGAAAHRVDSFHAHSRRTGREHAELRVKHQLLAHRERNGGGAADPCTAVAGCAGRGPAMKSVAAMIAAERIRRL